MNESEISVNELKNEIEQNPNLLLIDVRSQQERDMFNIGGEAMPLQSFQEQMGQLDKNKDIVIYCHTGARSLMAVHMLKEVGFASARSLSGGMVAWQAQTMTTA